MRKIKLFIFTLITHFKVYFIDDLGGIDLFDTLSDLVCLEDNIFGTQETELKLIMFIDQMCSALNYFQECKIGHFDIKPKNIVYNDKESEISIFKKI